MGVTYELWRPGPEIWPILRRLSVSEEALAGLCTKKSAVGAMKAWYMGLHLDGRL